jgi:hypothetical protein
MNHGRVLYHLVKADFLQRVRGYSFLFSLAGVLYVGYTVVAEKTQLRVGDGYRGVYNSAWLGALLTLTCSVIITLIGFYVVKNSLQRDVDTRVGQILATTPMRKPFYTLAKMLSNFAVLAAMVGVMMAVALLMQFLRAEDVHVNIWKLWSPFIFVALPAVAVTAALAILFETLPVLRGGVGNVIYFFAWTFALAAGVKGVDDFAGFHVFIQSMQTALHKLNPNANAVGMEFRIGTSQPAHIFSWDGVTWTVPTLLLRFGWLCGAVGLALLASLFFHRFDPAREWRKTTSAKLVPKNGEVRGITMTPQAHVAHLTPVTRCAGPISFLNLVIGELRLLLKGHSWWWYTVAAGLFIATLTVPLAGAQGVLLAAWLWPVLVWSQMGSREARFATSSFIFSSEKSLYRQLPALWMAGFLVAAVTGGGLGIRLLVAADWQAAVGWLAGAIFIPSLSLALGVWSGSSKPFEALYTIWWYIGPAHHTPGMDFMALSDGSRSTLFYMVFAAALFLVAFVGRRQRLGYA